MRPIIGFRRFLVAARNARISRWPALAGLEPFFYITPVLAVSAAPRIASFAHTSDDGPEGTANRIVEFKALATAGRQYFSFVGTVGR